MEVVPNCHRIVILEAEANFEYHEGMPVVAHEQHGLSVKLGDVSGKEWFVPINRRDPPLIEGHFIVCADVFTFKPPPGSTKNPFYTLKAPDSDPEYLILKIETPFTDVAPVRRGASVEIGGSLVMG